MTGGTPTQIQLNDELDRILLHILTDGRQVIDKETGEPVTITPTAADLNVIRQRLKDCGISPDGTQENSLISQVAQELRERARPRLADPAEEEDIING